ncbi:MAG: LysR family transcriptional regulator [Lachnospirales bacterium]
MDDFDIILIKSLYEDKIITNVSKNLFVSQPALTKRLKKLEQEFNATLFIRSKKGVSFTESGLLLYEYCKRNIEEKEHLKRKINNLNNTHHTLKIGCATAFALHELPIMLCNYYKNRAKVEIIIKSNTSYENYLSLNNKKINIAIIRESYSFDGKKIKLSNEPVYFVYNKKIKYNDLSKIPLITYESSPSLDNLMYKWLEENNISKDTAIIKASNAIVALKLVEEGAGWSILPLLHLKNYTGYKEELTLENKEYTRTTYLYYNLECENDLIAMEFINFVKNYYNV